MFENLYLVLRGSATARGINQVLLGAMARGVWCSSKLELAST